MPLPVLICDDSALARKQIARSLPKDWDISISFAEHGEHCLESIQQGKGDIVFLDLNMPIMDGYQVLETIQRTDLPSIVIVISSDIQPQAHAKVKALGALEFIEKPINSEKLITILAQYGIYKAGIYHSHTLPKNHQSTEQNSTIKDILQELSNIAMGKTGNLLSRLLNAFILLPIPKVESIQCSELNSEFAELCKDETVSVIHQGFISSGINGEAILLFHNSSFDDMSKLLKYENITGNNLHIEMMNDIANILIGAFLNAIAEQLDIHFSQGQPSLLGQYGKINKITTNEKIAHSNILTIKVHYSIQEHDIKCDLLLMLTEDSLTVIKHKIGYLLE